ncbi:hypothetical protein [Brevundimonas naejangsanensis]|uniref:hypothetical protein n=1 Tax=Brevundimonas naejangsanensis TaxID=588932 RepID=UPI0032094624
MVRQSPWSSLIESIRHHRAPDARFFKPTCVISAIDLADEGSLDPENLNGESVVERFDRYVGILAGLPLDDVATTIHGWELKKVKEIARRYVTGEAIGLGMIARLQETANKQPTVKPSVNPSP